MRRPVGVKTILFSFCQASFFFSPFLSRLPSGHCRHASIRTLEERLVSLGAHWAFSFQPVLLSDWRPVVLLLTESNLGQAINAVTGTRLFGFHEKAGRSQVGCFVFSLDKFVSPAE